MCVEFQVGKQIGRCEPTHGTQAELLDGLESGGPSLRDPSFGQFVLLRSNKTGRTMPI